MVLKKVKQNTSQRGLTKLSLFFLALPKIVLLKECLHKNIWEKSVGSLCWSSKHVWKKLFITLGLPINMGNLI